MNSLYQSFLSMKNQMPTDFAFSFSNEIKLSTQEVKIISIAATVLGLLSLLVYGIYRWHYQRTVVLQDDEEEYIVQKIAQEKLKENEIFDDSSEKLEKKSKKMGDLLEKDIPLEQSPSLKSNSSPHSFLLDHPNPSIKKEIPPLPALNYADLFTKLSNLTDCPSNLPFSDNCRFGNILCPKDTRVHIPANNEKIYLHANHVHLEGVNFILMQYPLSIHFRLFWQASKSACLILDLTNHKDMGKGLMPYAPKLNSQIQLEEEVVQCLSMEELTGINAKLYTYKIEGNDSNSIPCIVPRLHYENWDDHMGILENDLDQVIAIFEHYQKDPTIPVIIHCRAGVGRSGTIAVAYALHQLIKQKKVDASNLEQHINHLILKARKQRGENVVQTDDQLATLYRWAWRAIHLAQ